MIEYAIGTIVVYGLYKSKNYISGYIREYVFPNKTLSIEVNYIDKEGNIDKSKTEEKIFENDSKCSFNQWQSYEDYCDELIKQVANNPEKYKDYDAVIVKNKKTNEELIVYSLFGSVYLDRTPRV
jgi:hypothetical protein